MSATTVMRPASWLKCKECGERFERNRRGRAASRCPKCRKGTAAKRAPAGGYVSMEKAAYRDAVWSRFADLVGPRLLPHAVAVLMPGKDGTEIGVAIRHGFRERNIICVDDNPAIIATAKWRTRYPSVRCYGSEVGRAFERMVEDGVRVDVANLDYCGNFSTPIVESVRRVRESGALRDMSAVAITVLRGREDTATITALRMLYETKKREAWGCDMRLDALFHELEMRDRLVASGEYQSQTQRMAWAIAAKYPIGGELYARAEALAASGVSMMAMARLVAWRDDLQKALNGKPELRFPRYLHKSCRQCDSKGYPWSCRKHHLRARRYCERKLERVNRRITRMFERARDLPASRFPAPSMGPGGFYAESGDTGPLKAFYSVHSTGYYGTPGGAHVSQFLVTGPWLPFDEWLVNRGRLSIRAADRVAA